MGSPSRAVELRAVHIQDFCRNGSVAAPGSSAAFEQPEDDAVDGAGTLYVTDLSRIRKITSGGAVTAFAGLPPGCYSLCGAAEATMFSKRESPRRFCQSGCSLRRP